ncbi:hypothetical protein [Gemmatimonas sp.]|uniref:hypothetical protein n=1 Tax=Gemmatimonas sp. TaxID=1962908 RepID=UPI003983B661
MSRALNYAGIPFMLTGSVAAGYRGASRATMNVDAVIDPTAPQLRDFLQCVLDAGLYVSEEAASDALAFRGMFNVVDPNTGWKADLIVRKDRTFSEGEFARREFVHFLGVELAVATLEDIVLSKLEWATLGASSRQLEDVRALLRINEGDVDMTYIERWVDVLCVRRAWESVRA